MIEKSILPAVFAKVVEAKQLMSSGQVKTALEATKQVGVSRTAFYKYKDKVFMLTEREELDLVTLNILLKDEVGALSELILTISKFGGDILTINQNIPSEGVAPVSVSIRVDHMELSVAELLTQLQGQPFVLEAMLVKAQ